MHKAAAYEQELMLYAEEKLRAVDRVKVTGDAREKKPIAA
jgi:selenocysteine lyase/cysteine desulfurase